MSCTLKTVVALSLLLNLLLAGFILGHAGRSLWQNHLHTSIADAAKELPQEKRAHFEVVMHQAEKNANALYIKLDKSREKAIALLKKDPFDKRAFLAQVKDMERIHIQLRQQVANAIVQVSDELSPQERMLTAELLRRPHPPGNETPKIETK